LHCGHSGTRCGLQSIAGNFDISASLSLPQARHHA